MEDVIYFQEHFRMKKTQQTTKPANKQNKKNNKKRANSTLHHSKSLLPLI